MEDLFQFLFGASGRISRAKYWRSVLFFSLTGLMTAVILFTAVSIAASFFIVMVVLIFIPWLLWGFSFTTERLHDRDKSAWWLVVFYLVPGVLGHLAEAARVAGSAGTTLNGILALASFSLTIWGFVEVGCLRGTNGLNTYGPDPVGQLKRQG